jgi:hypothetical protein
MTLVARRQSSPVRAPEGKAMALPRKLSAPTLARDTRNDVLE